MGWADKVPMTHQEHFETLKKLNTYHQGEIDLPLKVLDKRDFCIAKPPRGNDIKEDQFNPYSLDPQNIGHQQCLTSTLMHTIMLQILYDSVKEKLSTHKHLRLLDLGCGFGYSTLALSLMISQMCSEQHKIEIIGTDIQQEFIERAIMNLQHYKKHFKNLVALEPDFKIFDFVEAKDLSSIGKFDICNFGFETSLQTLEQRKDIFNEQAVILAPISQEEEGSLEQMYTLLQYKNNQFNVTEDIMKTSFSLRVDKTKALNKSLDQDYFNTSMRQSKIEQFKIEISAMEALFKALKEKHIGAKEVKLAELIKVPEIVKVLSDLRDKKKKLLKLEYAMQDTLDSANEKESEGPAEEPAEVKID